MLDVVRVLERSEFKCDRFGFRLAQEGLPTLVPHMGRRLLFVRTSELRTLLERR